eukprot:2310589-Rhodomonas_salina.1
MLLSISLISSSHRSLIAGNCFKKSARPCPLQPPSGSPGGAVCSPGNTRPCSPNTSLVGGVGGGIGGVGGETGGVFASDPASPSSPAPFFALRSPAIRFRNGGTKLPCRFKGHLKAAKLDPPVGASGSEEKRKASAPAVIHSPTTSSLNNGFPLPPNDPADRFGKREILAREDTAHARGAVMMCGGGATSSGVSWRGGRLA